MQGTSRQLSVPPLCAPGSASLLRRHGAAVLCGLLGLASPVMAASEYAPGVPRTAYVNLFEWKWSDIGAECRNHLGPRGYAAVQVSPPQASIAGSAWWTRYQPVSYQISGRSGSEEEFRAMVSRCAQAGVDVYVDVVFNHMAANNSRDYPAVPYGPGNFHAACDIVPADYDNNRGRVLNCSLPGLPDLDTAQDPVRNKIADYLNHLRSLGVAGFRIDAAKHMHEDDIRAILNKVPGSYFVTQETIGDGVTPLANYFKNGTVNEFKYIYAMRNAFDRQGGQSLSQLKTVLDPVANPWGLVPSLNATVFVNNHDTERKKPDGVHYDSMNVYFGAMHRLAHTFMLAWPYGYPQVMSGYYFNHDHDMGPPSSPVYNDPNGSAVNCTADVNPTGASGWDCTHRSRFIAGMVGFRNWTNANWYVSNWVSDSADQIAFSRGNRGFVVINRHDTHQWARSFQTGLAAGSYCDVISGGLQADGRCSGKTVQVDGSGFATLSVGPMDALAIHIGAKANDGDGGQTRVTFTVRATTSWGEAIHVVGNTGALGNWSVTAALPCTTTASTYPLWTCQSVALPAGQTIEYKYLKRNGSTTVWETGSNRSYAIPATGTARRDDGNFK